MVAEKPIFSWGGQKEFWSNKEAWLHTAELVAAVLIGLLIGVTL